MPPNRLARPRVVNNENDENVGTTRVTRAKAAALGTSEDTSNGALKAKKPLQAKKAGTNTLGNANNAPAARKRAALGDVSNVTKADATETKEVKKVTTTTTAARTGLVSKASHNGGVQKLSRPQSTRPALASKEPNTKKTAPTELKRPASGSGVLSGAHKKRQTSTSAQKVAKHKDVIPEAEVPEPAPQVPSSPEDAGVEQVARKASVDTEADPELEAEVDAEEQEQQHLEWIIRQLDSQDYGDPLMVSEYVNDIFDHLKSIEPASMPNPDYMDHQDDLEWKMRGILIDWLIEVHTRFHLLPETLFLAVNIIDRFLSTKVVLLDRLQLVGITAMFIASKYEEVLSPHVANFRHVADDGFTEQEILSAERYVLSALNYDLSYPNPMNFLRRISKADHYDVQTRTFGKYLMEISLLDHRFLDQPPSLVAAASMYLARHILERPEWDSTSIHYSGYTEKDIEPVFKLMVDYLARPVAHEAFFKKYASKKFLKASILTRQWAKKYMMSMSGNEAEAQATR